MAIYRDYNYPFTFNNPPLTASEFNKIIKKHIPDPIVYCIFRKELGEETQMPHFQGYIELSRKMSYKAINELIFKNFPFEKEDGTKSWLSFKPRNGTQEQAINYFTNVDKVGYLPDEETHESGKKKADYATTNRKNNIEIPWTEDQQLVHIWKKTQSGDYKTLADVRKDYPFLTIYQKTKIKEILYDANPIDSILIRQALTICISGEPGMGKSTLSNLLTKRFGYLGTQVYRFPAYLAKSSVSPFFVGLSDHHKILFVEEMDEKTLVSSYQFWISLIDRNKPLNSKGGYIRNPFEVIIFNSVQPLYHLLAMSWERDGIDSISKQILRRCCNPIIGSYFIDIPDHIGNITKVEEKNKIILQSEKKGETTFKDPYYVAEWYFKDVSIDEIRDFQFVWDFYESAKRNEERNCREKEFKFENTLD